MAPTESGDFLIGVRAAYEELNRSVRSPEPCTYTRRVEGVDEERTGFLRWRSTRADEVDHHVILGTDPEDGRIWRQECFDPTLGEEYGDYLRVQFFPVTEANLARMAIDDFLLGLPSPTVHTAPANRTLVNLDTWFWVDGVDGGVRVTGLGACVVRIADRRFAGGAGLRFGGGGFAGRLRRDSGPGRVIATGLCG